MASALLDCGAEGFAVPAGLWVVLDAAPLMTLAKSHGEPQPADPGDPTQWLGMVDQEGQILSGPLEIAIWGFDSV